MEYAPYPQHTKQTRTNNNLTNEYRNDFFKPMFSNQSEPINYNHEHYTLDTLHKTNDIERSSISTRNSSENIKKPIQNAFQNNYHMMNFSTIQNINYNNDDNNNLLTRNPINTRRDSMEKIRNTDRQEFLNTQGGSLNNYADFKFQNTRNDRKNINSSNYVPMPRTMAIPKENI